jgi:hypothetical protein
MAVSGSTDFAMNGRQVITSAFTNAKIYAPGETISAEDMASGQEALNLMLKTWSAKEHLWIKTEGTVTLVAGQAGYTVATARRVHSVRRRTNTIDTPLNILSRDEYYDLPNKSATGMPVNWYFDPQTSSRTLYLWLVPSAAIAANTSLRFTYSRVIDDIDALENDPDVPQEWLEALIYSLSDRLANSYGSNNPALTRFAEQLMRDLSNQDQESASTYFQPSYR